MMKWLTAIGSFFTALNNLFNWFNDLKARSDAKAVVTNEVLQKEQESVRKADAIVLEHRDDSDVSQRLHDGRF